MFPSKRRTPMQDTTRRGHMRSQLGLLLLCSLLIVCGCRGKSGATSSSPTVLTPPAPVADPLVTIQVTYSCHPCTNDPDNYAVNIDCVNNRCGSMVRAQTQRLNTIR